MRAESLADNGQLDRQTVASNGRVLNDRGTVELDTTTMLVCKQFREPDAAEFVRREFDCLRRFSAVLAGQPFLRCPQPVRAEPEQGKIWTTWCPGSQLHHLAETSDAIEDDLDHIAEQVAIAVETYIVEFDEPYYDLAAWNMLYDAQTRTLSLLDFAGTGRDRLRHPDLQHAPVDVSLGCLIGTTVYHTVRSRRGSWRKQRYWKRQERLIGLMLARLDAQHSLRPLLIRTVSHVLYDALGKQSGRPLRLLWFRTAGQALFNRRSDAIIARLAPGA